MYQWMQPCVIVPVSLHTQQEMLYTNPQESASTLQRYVHATKRTSIPTALWDLLTCRTIRMVVHLNGAVVSSKLVSIECRVGELLSAFPEHVQVSAREFGVWVLAPRGDQLQVHRQTRLSDISWPVFGVAEVLSVGTPLPPDIIDRYCEILMI